MDHDDYVLRDPHEPISLMLWACHDCGHTAPTHEFHQAEFCNLTEQNGFLSHDYNVLCPECNSANTSHYIPLH